MEQAIKISVYTQVYNTNPLYLRQCIESVLNQTYKNIEYIIIDRGSNDGSQDILREYAEKDTRIQLIRFEDNAICPLVYNVSKATGDGKYLTVLDSDDWLELEFLEQMIELAEKNDLDIVCTNSYVHYEGTGKSSFYHEPIDHNWIIEKEKFPYYFPKYFNHFTVYWGKLIRLNVMRQSNADSVPIFPWDTDTMWCFRLLSQAKRIAISNFTLCHYRKRQKTLSTTYYETGFDGSVFLYSELINFLNSFGSVQKENVDYVDIHYIAEIIAAFNMLKDSSCSTQYKLKEYYRMLDYPLTQVVFNRNIDASPEKKNLIKNILQIIISTIKDSDLSVVDKLKEHHEAFAHSIMCKYFLETQEYSAVDPEKREVMKRILHLPAEVSKGTAVSSQEKIRWLPQAIAPHCYAAITTQNAELFLQDRSFIRKILGDQRLEQFYIKHHRMFLLFFGSHSPLRFIPGNGVPLFQSLLQDDAENLLLRLKQLSRNKCLAKQYALPEAIEALCQTMKESI